MNKVEFLFHLQGASFQAFKFAESYIDEELKSNFKYDITFLEAERERKIASDLTDIQVVDFLYIESKVPTWIDINVLKYSKEETTLNLLCSVEYTNRKEDFRYNHNGSGPFGVKSPKLPSNYTDGMRFTIPKY